ncbi:hypothetical protein [Pantanalinema sp. GBBB05]|uniref:hypothetical protein n=1 Tax=Pantanalinema sp. GBBB05 TaxID=2604139 RepID=UPI003D81B56B
MAKWLIANRAMNEQIGPELPSEVCLCVNSTNWHDLDQCPVIEIASINNCHHSLTAWGQLGISFIGLK